MDKRLTVDDVNARLQEVVENYYWNGTRHEGLSLACVGWCYAEEVEKIAALFNEDEELRHTLDEPTKGLNPLKWRVIPGTARFVSTAAKARIKELEEQNGEEPDCLELRIWYND